MKNNWFDVEIITTTKKKWNLAILIIFPLVLFLSFIFATTKLYLMFIIWIVAALLFLFYDLIRSKSIVELSTRLLFKDDCFSIITSDKTTDLQIKREDVTKIILDKNKNHVSICKNDKILYEFNVKSNTLDELYDVFNSFGYNCEVSSFIN